jgi:uncharacterized protein YndB with AHSA1/START domain
MVKTVLSTPVRKAVIVAASPERAFDVFTDGMGRWWPKSHHIGTSDLDAYLIEPKVNGRWYERGVDGTECEIGKVLVWEPPNRLVLGWQVTPDWKFDPNLLTEVEVLFLAEGTAITRVELEHRNLDRLGYLAEAFREQIDSPIGWSGLLELFARSAAQRVNNE